MSTKNMKEDARLQTMNNKNNQEEDVSSSSPMQDTFQSSSSDKEEPWYYISLVPPLYVCWRVYLANRMPIADCDEVYNYWEPLHFVLYGSGMQTWEYAHEYALRTYSYILPLQLLAKYFVQPLLPFLLPLVPYLTNDPVIISAAATNDKLAIFLFLRATLGAVTALAELALFQALSLSSHAHQKQQQQQQPITIRPSTLRWMALVMMTVTGMNHAAAAFLPSATWMVAWMLAAACYLTHCHVAFIAVAVTATLTTGWPFGVIMLLPMGLAILYKEHVSRNKFLETIALAIAMASYLQGLVMAVDQAQYGIWNSPTLNIFLYNAAGGGDELYGTEPASYYVKNLLLNLNIVAPLGLASLPICVVFYCYSRRCSSSSETDDDVLSSLHTHDIVVLLSPLALWLAVTVPRPHKEERFLFPLYPLLVVGAVLAADMTLIRGFLGGLMATLTRHKRLSKKQTVYLHLMLWVPVVVLSLSRTAVLSKYYSAPATVYAALAKQAHAAVATSMSGGVDDAEPSLALVCTCGEWYRFPSSFFLPAGVQLGFLPSSFRGQLPQPFSKHGSGRASPSVLQPFNDRNLEQTERYVQNPARDCTWIIDLQGSECWESLSKQQEQKPILVVPFLDADNTSTIHRILYLPYFHERAISTGQVRYRNYALYKVDGMTQVDEENADGRDSVTDNIAPPLIHA